MITDKKMNALVVWNSRYKCDLGNEDDYRQKKTQYLTIILIITIIILRLYYIYVHYNLHSKFYQEHTIPSIRTAVLYKTVLWLKLMHEMKWVELENYSHGRKLRTSSML